MNKIIFALASMAFLFCSCNKDGGVDNKYAGQPVIGTWQQVDEYYHASVVELKANGEFSWTIAPIPMIRSTGTYVYKDNTITFNEQAWWQFERNDDSSTDGQWVRLSSLEDEGVNGIACKEVKIIEDHTSFMIWQFDEHTYFPGGRENIDDLKHPMFLQEDCKVKDSDIIGTWKTDTELDANAKSYVVLGENHSYISYSGYLVGGPPAHGKLPRKVLKLPSSTTTLPTSLTIMTRRPGKKFISMPMLTLKPLKQPSGSTAPLIRSLAWKLPALSWPMASST